jgi:hypothetical protein
VSHRGPSLIGRVNPRQHHSRRTGIERAADPNPGVGLDPHDRRHAVRRGHRNGRPDLLLAAGTVLEVEQQPVESGRRTHLGRDRGRGIDERAQRPFRGGHPGPQPAVV